MKKGDISKYELNAYKKLNQEIHYHSQFNFLNSHRGYRPGALHLFLGIAGGGKSTLTRSMLLDLMASPNKPKILLWLSEESYKDYMTELSLIRTIESWDNLYIVSELEDNFIVKNIRDKIAYFEHCIIDSECDLIFYDNITTSELYTHDGLRSEKNFASQLKFLASKHSKPIILLSHTNGTISDFYDRLIQPNDIRGNKTIVNLAQFLYVMQQFQIQEEKFSTVRICKHRGQDIIGKFYKMKYESRLRCYVEDKMLNFEEFKELFKQRNKL